MPNLVEVSTVDFFVETVQTLVLFSFYCCKAVFLIFVPSKYRAKKVEGERILITGAGSGLGRGLALRFAQKKAVLILCDINGDANEETADICRNYGAKVYTHTCDVSNRAAIYETAEKVIDDVRDIDILINNAGIVTGKKILDCPDELMEKTMQVNSMSHFWTTKAFLPSMLARNHGHVVTIASAAGLQGVSGLVDYCASKFAAVGFHESLQNEIAFQKKKGVFTTVVCPTYIDTGMFSGAVTSRFSTIMPNLKTDDAVNRIFWAILTNQQVLYMPRMVYLLIALKGVVPVPALQLLMSYFHSDRCMTGFVGRDIKSD